MKKAITLITAVLALANAKAQISVTADFEEFQLPLDSFYLDTNGTDFTASSVMNFQYDWTKSNWGDYWSGGFAYSTMRDTITEGYTNEYSAITGKGHNNSKTYVVGQNNASITIPVGILRSQFNPNGFFVTNSTYAYKSMLNGDFVGKKFGGNSGNEPDWFKLVVKSALNGNLNTDSAVVYLADFRSDDNTVDYILKEWKFVDISHFGTFDSLFFQLYSSDVGNWGMNTPAYFCLDYITTPYFSSVEKLESSDFKFELIENPVKDNLKLSLTGSKNGEIIMILSDILGKMILNTTLSISKGTHDVKIPCDALPSGIYSLLIRNNERLHQLKFIKE